MKIEKEFTNFLMEDISFFDVISISDSGNRKRVITRFRISAELSQSRMEQFKSGGSVDLQFKAKATVSHNGKILNFECYIKIPAVQLNAVGTTVYEEAYAIAFIDCGEISEINKAKLLKILLLDRTENIPEI